MRGGIQRVKDAVNVGIEILRNTPPGVPIQLDKNPTRVLRSKYFNQLVVLHRGAHTQQLIAT
jgi:hypothetical protein